MFYTCPGKMQAACDGEGCLARRRMRAASSTLPAALQRAIRASRHAGRHAEWPCRSREGQGRVDRTGPVVPGFNYRRFFGCNAALGRRSDLWSLNVRGSAVRLARTGQGVGLPRLQCVPWSHSWDCPVESFLAPSSVSASSLRLPLRWSAASRKPSLCWQRMMPRGHPAP